MNLSGHPCICFPRSTNILSTGTGTMISSVSIDRSFFKAFMQYGRLSTFHEQKKKQIAPNFDRGMNEKQTEVLRNIISSQEKEKDHIGRELHDNINQVLATVKMYLGIARSDQSRSEEMVEICFNYIDELIAEVRGLSHSLVSPSLGDMSLYDALKQMAHVVNVGKKIDVRLVDKGIGHINDQNIELTFYRIAQEQMSNILKHAQADKVTIALENTDDHFTMTITDDGVGFNPTGTLEGIGLKNVYNRLSVYSGKMSIQSAPGQGCSLQVSIPKQ